MKRISSKYYLFLKKHYLFFPTFIISAILVYYIGLFFHYGEISYLISWLIILLAIVIFGLLHNKIHREFMEYYGQLNNWQFVPKLKKNPEFQGCLFDFGRCRKYDNLLSGAYHNCQLHIFNYQYQTGFGKNTEYSEYTIFTLRFACLMPNFILENRSCPFNHSFFDDHNKERTLQLEGNFNQFFNLFTNKDEEIEILQILTPDVMEQILIRAQKYNLEIMNGDVYIYAKKYLGTTEELDEMFDLAKYFIDKLLPIAKRIY